MFLVISVCIYDLDNNYLALIVQTCFFRRLTVLDYIQHLNFHVPEMPLSIAKSGDFCQCVRIQLRQQLPASDCVNYFVISRATNCLCDSYNYVVIVSDCHD